MHVIVIAAGVVILLFLFSSIRKRAAPKSTGYDTAVMRSLMLYEEDPSLHCDFIAPLMLPFYIRIMLKFSVSRKMLANRNSPGLFPLISARTVWFDQFLIDEIQNGSEQVVILGAALDSRAMRLEDSLCEKGVKVFELDLPPFISTKEAQIQRIHSTHTVPPHISLNPIDFTMETLDDVLVTRDVGYEQNKKTTFLWEGVCMYLTEEAVASVLSFVKKHPKGSTISFDYINEEFLQHPENFYGGKETYSSTKSVDEEYKFGLQPSQLGMFAEKYGMKVKRHVYGKDVVSVFRNKQWGQTHKPFDFVGFVTLQVV